MESLEDRQDEGADNHAGKGRNNDRNSQADAVSRLRGNDYPLWSPRFWNGMTLRDFMRLAGWRLHQVSPSRWHMYFIVLISSLVNSLLAFIQWIFFCRRINRQKLPDNPVFVIGHFRTGTTMLLEHLACDDQFVWPTTYQCFSPRHFLITQGFLPFFMKWLMPNKRPMDNMDTGFSRPQEDEFAMLSMAAPTIYQRIAFPNQPAPFMETLTLDACDSKVQSHWRASLTWFYRAITLGSHKRLLIKSPVHTGRIATLIEMFPNARFVHITRNPAAVFPSLQNAWRVLDLTQGFEAPDNDQLLDESIFKTLEEMYRGYWQAAESLQPEQLCEIKYEDLTADPMGVMQKVYEQLNLGDFESMRPALQKRIDSLGEYRINQFDKSDNLTALKARWTEYRQRYDYT